MEVKLNILQSFSVPEDKTRQKGQQTEYLQGENFGLVHQLQTSDGQKPKMISIQALRILVIIEIMLFHPNNFETFKTAVHFLNR